MKWAKKYVSLLSLIQATFLIYVLSVRVHSLLFLICLVALSHLVWQPLQLLNALRAMMSGLCTMTTQTIAMTLLLRIQASRYLVRIYYLILSYLNTYLDETDPNQGLQITFPIAISQVISVRSFQLVVNLLCDIDYVEISETPFTIDLFATDEGDIEIITVTGTSIYGKIIFLVLCKCKLGCPVDPDSDIENIDS